MSDTPRHDDPGWDLPAALALSDGRTAVLPDLTVRDAVELVRMALGSGELIGGEIDPRLVTHIGPDPDVDPDG